MPIALAADKEPLSPGRICFAPDSMNLGVNDQHRIVLEPCPAGNGICPSVAYLFESVHSAFGARSACVLLTGMGRDGAEELLKLRLAGAMTIVQDKASSAVFGMPSEAARLGAANHICPPEQMPELLIKWSLSLPIG
jgi:two-component system, chemotaxis family, protein-glutamate methylesterase/glutaminase